MNLFPLTLTQSNFNNAYHTHIRNYVFVDRGWKYLQFKLIDENTICVNSHDSMYDAHSTRAVEYPISIFGDEVVAAAREAILKGQLTIARKEFIRREEAEMERKVLEIRKELFGV